MLVDEVRFVADGIRTVRLPDRWRVEKWMARWCVAAGGDVLCAEAGVIDGSWYPLWHEAYEAARRGYALEFAALNGGVS